MRTPLRSVASFLLILCSSMGLAQAQSPAAQSQPRQDNATKKGAVTAPLLSIPAKLPDADFEQDPRPYGCFLAGQGNLHDFSVRRWCTSRFGRVFVRRTFSMRHGSGRNIESAGEIREHHPLLPFQSDRLYSSASGH